MAYAECRLEHFDPDTLMEHSAVPHLPEWNRRHRREREKSVLTFLRVTALYMRKSCDTFLARSRTKRLTSTIQCFFKSYFFFSLVFFIAFFFVFPLSFFILATLHKASTKDE